MSLSLALLLALSLFVPMVADAQSGLRPWTSRNPMNSPRTTHAMAVSGDYVYAIGGGDNPGVNVTPPMNSVEFASVAPDGTIGSWLPTTPLLAPRFNVRAVGVGSRIYVVGGWSNSGCCAGTVHYSSVEIGEVNADGTIAAWTYGSDLVQGVGHGAVVTDGQHLYHIGGYGGSQDGCTGIRDYAQVADIQADGSLSPWRLTTPLPAPRTGVGGIVAHGRIYVFGGWRCSSAILDGVVSAPILANGELGTWREEAAMLSPRYYPVAFAGRTKLFVGGGALGTASSQCYDQLSSFEEATISADGVLGAWIAATSLNLPRYGHAGAAAGRVFVVGAGSSGTCGATTSTETTACLDCAPVCGDGVVEENEACDDGNQSSGDCCSASCELEPAGSMCDDMDACTAGEVCDGGGLCAGQCQGPDQDGDGETDATDRCPNTPSGAAVDDSGCSQAEFCGRFDATTRDGVRDCKKADWRNDEPRMRRPDVDCVIDRADGGSAADDRCVAAP